MTQTKTKRKPFFQILKQSALGIYYVSPMIISVLALAALLITFITPDDVKSIFQGNTFLDTLYGAILGGIMMGNAMVSYILGSELQNMGVSIYAITAFLLAWVSIGYLQIPMEISFFGRRFTFIRNLLAIIFTFIISILIVITYESIR
jgi:uncharacterized membrane protein YraQ (UPF0718 family)